MFVRGYQMSDCKEITELFYNTVHTINAKDYTKEQLSNANTIELELNNDGDSEDKYGRLLAWVFVDGELLQKKLAQEGLVEKFYDYGYDYTYSELIINADKEARMENRGIYSEN